jgi:hypothetical protein
VSTPFGIVPGLIPTYFFGRKRKTVRIEYDSKLSFSMTDQTSGVLVFASGHKIRESKIRATPEGISRIAELLSRDHDQ